MGPEFFGEGVAEGFVGQLEGVKTKGFAAGFRGGIRRVATHILAFEGESNVTWFDGNYSEYEEHRKKLLGTEAERPHRIKYKKLMRT